MNPPALRVVTPHASVAEFIYSFCRVVDQQHMLVALKRPRPQGETLRFSVCLTDGRPVFEGVGRVVDLHARRGGEPATGAKIELVALDHESRTMHICLMMARTATPPRRLQADAVVPANPVGDVTVDAVDELVDHTFAGQAPAAQLPGDESAKLVVPAPHRRLPPPVRALTGVELDPMAQAPVATLPGEVGGILRHKLLFSVLVLVLAFAVAAVVGGLG
jgi:hypothetical protein